MSLLLKCIIFLYDRYITAFWVLSIEQITLAKAGTVKNMDIAKTIDKIFITWSSPFGVFDILVYLHSIGDKHHHVGYVLFHEAL